jgi:glycosyltransferase involved in cell wall biosynthesis
VRFLIVGDGKEWDKIRQLASQYGVLDTTFRMWRRVPKEEVPVILAAATLATSLFLPLPSLRDNSANKFFDALAAGRPIAINYGGWQSDLLRQSGAGFVLDAYELEKAAESVVAHLRDTEWLALAGKAAHRLAVEQFSRDALFDRFEEVLTQAVTGGRRRMHGRRRGLGRGAVTEPS